MTQQKPVRGYLLLGLRGMLMGAVNVVPGVSAGTIALITGIYEDLIFSLKAFNGRLLRMLAGGRIRPAWHYVNGNFLAPVVLGVMISIFTLARFLSWLFEMNALLVWAFFFGLIIGSAFYLGRKISRWSLPAIFLLLAGTFFGYYIGVTAPASGLESLWYIFISGVASFSTLVLPGISGAFVLALLGKYEFMLRAVSELQILVLIVFGAGGIAGILAFANLIGWLLKTRANPTLALLTGIMAGSLYKLWPWKKVMETRISASGEEVPLIERSISPSSYALLYGEDPQLVPVLILAFTGMALILFFTFYTPGRTAGKTDRS